MKYPAYPQYKDSGVAWLGEVPVDWEVKKARYLASMKGGSTPLTTENQFWDDGNIPWVSPKDMKIGRITDTQDHLTSEGASQCASGILAPGHVLIVVRSGILRHSLPVAINDVPVTLNQDMRAFKLGARLDAEYLRWFIEGNQKLLLEQWCKSGTTVESIEMSYLADGLIPVPPRTEQTTIADFLDRETGRIDTLVAKKRKLVELLKEKRSALISRTVTRGLPADAAREFGLTTGNAAVHEAPGAYGRRRGEKFFAPTDGAGTPEKFKDSGVEWLGEIPVDWVITNLGFASTKIGSGKTPTGGAETYVSDGVMFLRSQNVYDEGLLLDDVVFIAEEVDVEMSASRVFPNDVLLNITGASIGRTSIVPAEFPLANVNQHVCIIRLKNKVHSYFIAWVMKSSSVKAQIENAQTGAAREGLNFSQISKIKLALPPITEQTAIATYLDRETAKIDRLVETVETAIARLQEYRSALITAAVTGKIDVRAYSAKQETA
ncbi:restriction endonuclease subunit S [Methylomonas koyamae]|uniref:restriction endonuclease subunit S n=1 Tax=Methylomonas koyamae TaxID=702114 RepID=UPI00112B5CE8|nr:restriction endonuclease subunit S [Methylomonas koyamae]TPQ27639.1 hypothetical protein C2U68_07990 [Methylomonas koyamae]